MKYSFSFSLYFFRAQSLNFEGNTIFVLKSERCFILLYLMTLLSVNFVLNKISAPRDVHWRLAKTLRTDWVVFSDLSYPLEVNERISCVYHWWGLILKLVSPWFTNVVHLTKLLLRLESEAFAVPEPIVATQRSRAMATVRTSRRVTFASHQFI